MAGSVGWLVSLRVIPSNQRVAPRHRPPPLTTPSLVDGERARAFTTKTFFAPRVRERGVLPAGASRDRKARHAPPPIPSSQAGYPSKQALLTVFAVLVIMISRRPEAFLHPTLWAEDGPIFLEQAANLGVGAITSPYNGYHHFGIRLIAAFTSLLDVRWAPLAYLVASTCIVILLTLALFSQRVALPRPTFLALAVVLVPQTGEVHNTLTNIQWMAAVGLILLLISKDATTTATKAFDHGLAGLLGLTGIFSILFTPLFVVRALARRSQHSVSLALLVSTAAAIQWVTFLRSSSSATAVWDTPALLVRTFAERTIGSLIRAAPFEVSTVTLLVITATVACALLAASTRQRERRSLFAWFGAAIVLLSLATAVRFQGNIAALVPPMNGDRYFFVPKLLLIWLCVLAWDTSSHARWVARIVCITALGSSFMSWRFTPYQDYGWSNWTNRLEAAGSLVVPINPAGTTVTLRVTTPARLEK